MKRLILLALSLCQLFIGSASGPASVPENKDVNVEETGFSNPFANVVSSWNANVGNTDMYREIEKEENFLFSPYSIKDCFYTLYDVSEGESKEEMEEVFGFSEKDSYRAYDKNVTSDKKNPLSTANRAFLNKSKIKNINTKALKDIEVDVMDMDDSAKAAKHINEYISDHTGGMIKELIEEDGITDSTMTVLANALYFNAKWDKDLDIGDYDLRWNDGEEYSAFAGKMTIKNVKVIEDSNVDVLKLPYATKKGDYSLYIICDRNNDFTVDEMMKDITDEELDELLDFSGYTAKDLKGFDGCVFKIPDFEIEYTESVSPYLQRMGLEAPFNPNTHDFDKLASMYVSDVPHGAKITVDEAGTEAAAATLIEAKEMLSNNGSADKGPLYVTVTTPFVFVLKDDAKNIDLFMGRVNKPTSILLESDD